MPTEDSEYLRQSLLRLIPGLEIEEIAKPSGQRVVYFSSFNRETAKPQQVNWGQVVLKVTEELSDTQISYLQREIKYLTELNSKYFPKLYYHNVFFEDPETEERFPKPLFVTIEERILGKPLSECKNLFSQEDKAASLLLELIKALSVLWNHEKRLIHRDVKPDNILIKEKNEIVILDLGILREEGAKGITNTFALWGPCTPLYASPEQAKNEKRNIIFKSDFFSLGILIYELIVKVHPFLTKENMGVDEILYNVINFTPPTLKALNKTSHRFSNLIEKLISKEPYQRPRTIESLRAELDSILEGYK